MNRLFTLIQPFLTFKPQMISSSLQTLTWMKLCDKAVAEPEKMTALETFQISKFMQKAIDYNNARANFMVVDEISKIQNDIKIKLAMHGEATLRKA